MSTTITHLAVQEHVNELLREARRHSAPRERQQHRRHVKVRRVAVIRPEGSHFRVLTAPR
jgi:hypothetical protein